MKNYKVGQVLYLIKVEQQRILPVQVVEEVIRTTVDGKEKTYSIKFPDKKETVVDISRINGILYESTQELQLYMINNAKNAIQGMIENAVDLSSIFKKVVVHEEVKTKNKINKVDNSENVQNNINEDIIKVEIANGKFANLKSSELKKLGDS
jgi:hypothetical protein